ncbi:hypothetical protein N7532_000620 [Penicillium argentinense]|uniref:Uncharacterized protein n=1 Tax=Penicillium argentinense TaxID=1131581 RepID=A0A9W9KNG9_9EURO|nr:uncharacterized protein N7532_000620 [Penicillium argentinense]KAJ5112575.1 hypothetical protein N7532_000620 [Penicillium argentinense]
MEKRQWNEEGGWGASLDWRKDEDGARGGSYASQCLPVSGGETRPALHAFDRTVLQFCFSRVAIARL